ncbi:MAG TPA: glycosyltransferase family 39 protein [Myxococcota bacterium]|nr:glycosyltransferase family 39 protein [Myxococcota bacterium]
MARIVFWAIAALVLFLHLGDRALWGSESRWAEISRNMLLTRDLFHPIINEAIYFDKPLLSYWLIIVTSFATGGLGELATRIPSALAGVVALWATRSLGRRLWTEGVAQSAGWILLTCLGFVFWSRTAAADMQNLAAVILAVAWFFTHERSPGLLAYLVFYLICVIGAQMKGLPAIAVPVLALVPWLLRERRWRAHLRVSHVAAALLCGALYYAPFYWAAHEALPQGYVSQASDLGGLDLVWRENITRFFHPFDHIEPFYLYLYELPRVLIPWSPLFIAALLVGLASLRRLNPHTRWLLEAIAVIFVFFSASGSRRWYYILPIAPFCALQMAVFLALPGWETTKHVCLRLIGAVLLTAGVVSLASPLLWPLALRWLDFAPPQGLRIATLFIGAMVLATFAVSHAWPEFLARYTGLDRQLAGLVVSAAVLLGGGFGVQQTSVEALRTTKPFALRLRELVRSPEEVVFYEEAPTDVIFYLSLPRPVSVIRGKEALRRVLEAANPPRLVVTTQSALAELQGVLPDDALQTPVAAEEVAPWGQPLPWQKGRTTKKLVALRSASQEP